MHEITCTCGQILPVSQPSGSIVCDCGRLISFSALDTPQQQTTVEGNVTLAFERPFDRVADFHRTLIQLTPRVCVTPVLIGINVLLFVLMLVFGVSPLQPTIPDLLKWGADFGPQTFSGEWWRLFTSMFIHIGIIHLALNMWVLAVAGPLVERMVGNIGFLLTYLVAGLCGSVASLFWNPMMVSAGASGAIFGIYGALLGLLVLQRGSIPPHALSQLRNSGLGFVFYNLVFGLTQPHIDSAAHVGGLVAGFLCGMVLSQPVTVEARSKRPVRNLLLVFVGAILVVGGTLGVYRRHGGVADAEGELQRFGTVEKTALDTYNAAVQKRQRQELSD